VASAEELRLKPNDIAGAPAGYVVQRSSHGIGRQNWKGSPAGIALHPVDVQEQSGGVLTVQLEVERQPLTPPEFHAVASRPGGLREEKPFFFVRETDRGSLM
jgi:hypothetical protein